MEEHKLDEKILNSQACSILAHLRDCGQLCDTVIQVEDVSFPVHRVIMSAHSPYFRALFTNEIFNNCRREVAIPNVSADVIKLIVDYCYTQNVQITTENVEKLLPVADQFHVIGLVKRCCDFLCAQLSLENVIGIRSFAQAYFCHTLEGRAHKYLMKNFVQIYPFSNEYLQMDIEELCSILSADELNVRDEDLVFDAAIRWIDHDPTERETYMVRLLNTMRLGLMTVQFVVEKIKSHPYVWGNEECRPIIDDTLRYLNDVDEDEEIDLEVSKRMTRHRLPNDIVLLFGGWSGGGPTNAIEAYDTRADVWHTCESPDTTPRAYHGTACLDNLIYVIGGFDGTEYFNTVRVFNPVTKLWTEVAPMHTKRCYVSVATLGGCIYAMGGFDGHLRQNSAEKYIQTSNQWTFISAMNRKRSDASAASLNDKLYICGGYNGQECLDSAECYDSETNVWTLITPMRSHRSGVKVIGYRNNIYALGGFNGAIRLNTGERYNPATFTWQEIPEMINSRSNFAIADIDGMIFVIGGFNGVSTIFNVECFDGDVDEWFDATYLNLHRSALSASVVSDLPNIKDYIRKDASPDTEAV